MIPTTLQNPTFLPEDVKEAFHDLAEKTRKGQLIQRIWDRDHTVWRPDPTEIENRLGWLDLPAETLAQLPSLVERVNKLLSRNLTDVVLLGMGGSSLCPEVFRRTGGSKAGCPRLQVLDTTVPDWVRQVTQSIQIESSLFIVASKSGGTIEVMSAFKHFWAAIGIGSSNPGGQFIAITDPGTGLEALAKEKGFAEIFLNRPDIGGRYSALSLFGIVPALLIGLDAEGILKTSKSMAEYCRNGDLAKNPGANLGLFMAACSAQGRDKLTLVIDPAYESLGLWIEQLIAESTGKEGKGILPVALEPLEYVSHYGSDRAFVVIAPAGKTSLPGKLDAMKAAGHPVSLLRMESPLDLGAQFFLWEFATALASHFLDIQPFDQPNVQEAKTLTGQVLARFQADGSLPASPPSPSPVELLGQANPGDYFSIMAYVLETPELELAFSELRQAVMKRYKLATTSGYGPRFLHSTGQYHKGGPNTGLFLQLVQDQKDLPIPGERYGYSVLCAAQALGDFQALAAKGRRVSRLELGPDTVKEIRALAVKVAEA
jgi:glucose-6-phosphate isomerase/transaldolase/glucose-6-phosphate isomerase